MDPGIIPNQLDNNIKIKIVSTKGKYFSAFSLVPSTDAINPKMPTGAIEIEATELRVLNDTRLAPFSPAEEAIQNEEVRLKYRYVDLRRPEMQRNFRLRHNVTMAIRNSLSGQGFLEIDKSFVDIDMDQLNF